MQREPDRDLTVVELHCPNLKPRPHRGGHENLPKYAKPRSVVFRLASKGELGLRPESRTGQSRGDGKLEELKAKQSATLVDFTGEAVEVVVLVINFARVGTIVVRVCGASGTR